MDVEEFYDEEFYIEDHVDEFKEYCCNTYRCPVQDELSSASDTQKALEEYITELRKELYIYSDKDRIRTVEDVYNDLSYILCRYCC